MIVLMPIRRIFLAFAAAMACHAQAEQYIGQAGCLVLNTDPVENESVEWHGGCKDGYAEGKGVLIWHVAGINDARYEGAMSRGRRQGEAAFQDHDGMIYWGGFIQNELHGPVHFERENKFSVDAVFEYGVLTGPVTAGFKSGDRYHGGWKRNAPDGEGVMTYATGGSYRGEWRNGNKHGDGTVTYPNGIERQVHYEQDIPEGAAIPKGKPREYRLHYEAASMYRLESLVSGMTVPHNKRYADMSPDDQQRVRAWFDVLQPDDVPPYPVNGLGEVFRAISEAHSKMGHYGRLQLDVLVDEQGAPQNVAIRRTPDAEISDFAGKVLLLIKYTPARCGGKPCAMRFPLAMELTPPR